MLPPNIGHAYQAEIVTLLPVGECIMCQCREVIPPIGESLLSSRCWKSQGHGKERQIIHRIYLIVSIQKKIVVVFNRLGFRSCGSHGGGVHAVCAFLSHDRPATVGTVLAGMAETQISVGCQLLILEHITHHGRQRRLATTPKTQREEMAVAYFGTGDDVDDMAIFIHHIFGRRVFDNLYAVHRIGGQLLQIDFQCRTIHVGRIAIYPYLHFARTTHGDVALYVHLHTGGILQGIQCCETFYRFVFCHVVVYYFAFHTVDGTRCSYRYGLQHLHIFL